MINHLTWSADGRYLAATLHEGEGLRVWETADWSLVGDDWDYGGKGSYGVAFDATDRLYTVAYDGLLRRYGGADFKLEGKSRTLGGKEPYSVAVHPNGDRIAVGFNDTTAVEVYRAKDLQRLFAADTGVNIPRDGRFVVVAYGDGTIRWLRLSDGAEVLALFVNAQNREWVLWTPQGYYASSVAGDQNIGWQLNKGWEQAGEFVTAAQLKKHFYRPDIIKRAFDLADAGAAVREAGLSGFKLADLTNHTPPKFRIGDPGDKSHADRSPVLVKIELAATDDPVTGFDVTVNGRQVTPRAVRDLPLTTESQIRALNIPLEKGENHIQVTAHNKVGDSVQDLLVYLDREGVIDKKGKLFVLAIGVDKYPKFDAIHWLHYAAADARLVLDTLTKQAGPLHTEVRAKLLVTGGDTPPTKANIEDALLFSTTRARTTRWCCFSPAMVRMRKPTICSCPKMPKKLTKSIFDRRRW